VGRVFWLAAAREGLDDDHPAAAAGTWTRQHARLVGFCCGPGYLWLFWARWHGERIAGACDIGRTVAIGEQAIVSDAVEAVRQDVDEEAADELVGGKRHRLVAGAASSDSSELTACAENANIAQARERERRYLTSIENHPGSRERDGLRPISDSHLDRVMRTKEVSHTADADEKRRQ
jgi:hypothetical protein